MNKQVILTRKTPETLTITEAFLDFVMFGKYAGKTVVDLNLSRPENKLSRVVEIPELSFLILDQLEKNFKGRPGELALYIAGQEKKVDPMEFQSGLSELIKWSVDFFRGDGPSIIIDTHGGLDVTDTDLLTTLVLNKKKILFTVIPNFNDNGNFLYDVKFINRLLRLEIPVEFVFRVWNTESSWYAVEQFVRSYQLCNKSIFVVPVCPEFKEVEKKILSRGFRRG